MKKIILFCFVTLLAVASCSKKRDSRIVWNDNFPSYFFDVEFGMPTQDAIDELKDSEFKFRKDISTADFVHFEPLTTDSFEFLGAKWRMLDLNVDNGKVSGIGFVNAYKTKEEAANIYLKVKKLTDALYKPTVKKQLHTIYFGDNYVAAGISCFKYKSVSNDSLYAVQLLFQKKPETIK